MRNKIVYIGIAESGIKELPARVRIARTREHAPNGYNASTESANRIFAIMKERGAEPDISFVNDQALWVFYWDIPQVKAAQ